MAWTRKSIAAPGRLHGGEYRIDGLRLGDVAMADDDAADLLRQRLDALLQRLALIGESKFGAMRAAGFGDAPGRANGGSRPP